MNLVISTVDNELVKSYDCLCSFNQDIKVVKANVVGRTLLLPDGIQKIRSNAFTDIAGIKTVIVPKTVKYIEANAFRSVRHVIFSERVSFKGLYVEKGWDNGLRDLDVGDTFKSLGVYCYSILLTKIKNR